MKNNGAYIFAGVVVVAFIAYQALVTVPQNRIEAQEAQFIYKQVKLDECKQSASQAYSDNWDQECAINGIDTKSADCRLPNIIAIRLAEHTSSIMDRCVETYK